MNYVFNFISFLWLVRISANVVSWTSLWWIKEYRFDRMAIHLKTKQGKKILFPSYRVPPRSLRSISVVCVSLSIIVLFFLVTGVNIVSVITADLLSFPLVSFIVLLSHIPIFMYHSFRIRQATAIMKRRSDVLVIGITGSYGKTSTKEYLSTILSDSVSTLKTQESKNSPIGIAEVIIRMLKPEHKVFVVEMGAYKIGEIGAMCDIVRPQIGIVLSVNPQHQDLFGSIETTMKAKYELIEHLSGKNIAIVNYDDRRVRTLSEWAIRDGHHVWFVTKESKEKLKNDTYIIADIESTLSRLRFSVTCGTQQGEVSTSIIGSHQVINITSAIAGAIAAGMPFPKAVSSSMKLTRVAHVLEKVKGIHGSVFIDDTFNNNPDAAKAAISILSPYKKRKILVFQPMIELGTYAQSSHYDVGVAAGKVCDEVLLVGEDWSEHFIKGVRASGGRCVVHVLSIHKAVAYLRAHVTSKDVILFKGKSAGAVLSGFRI